MRFLRDMLQSKKGISKSKTGISCRTNPLIRPKNSLYPKKKPKHKKHNVYSKGSASFFPSFSGSITIEAAFAVPLFLFFCIQIISVISLLQLHSGLEAALHQEICDAAVLAYAADRVKAETDSPQGIFLENSYLKAKVIKRAGKDFLDASMIEGGSSGIQTVCTAFDGGQDVIDMVLFYRVRPFADLLGFSGFTMGNRCLVKAWTGYRYEEILDGSGREELVYITETGSVYHKNRNCSYLNPSIRPAEAGILPTLRNQSGEKYYPCELCGGDAGVSVFLTDQGNRYHSRLNCSGLKRTVYVVPISEAGGRSACSKCGGTG